MSSNVKVVVLGASGRVGQFIIVPALLQAGMDITIITRPGKHYTGTGAKDIKTIEAAYDDPGALRSAFQGQGAIIEAFSPDAAVHQKTIVQAALAAGVKQLITNEFGHDSFHSNAAELPLSTSKIEAQRVLEEELKKATVNGEVDMTWTAIITSQWYDYAILNGFFPISTATGTITRFGSGNQKISLSRSDLVAEAVIAVLREPERFKNRPVYVASQTVSVNQLIELAKEIISDGWWNLVDGPDLDTLKKQGLYLWGKDRKNGVPQLGSQAFMILSAVLFFDENNRYGADFEEKAEPDWRETCEEFMANVKRLIEKVGTACS